jgi:CIC family chloride channel protein
MPKKTHIKDNEFTILLGMATLVGIIGGYGAVAFKYLLATIQDLAFKQTIAGQTMLERVISTPWYIKIAITSTTGFVVAAMIYYLASEAKGHGVQRLWRV